MVILCTVLQMCTNEKRCKKMSLKNDYLRGEMDGEKSKSDSALSKLMGTDHYNPPSDPDRAEAYKDGHREGRK